MIRILVAEPLSPTVLERLSEIPEFDIIESAAWESELPLCDAVIVRGGVVLDQSLLQTAQRLKLIVRAGSSLSNIDVEGAGRLGIEVRHTPEATAVTVAEFTLAVMLGICRRLGPVHHAMRNGSAPRAAFSDGIELFDKTLGIIGYGHIGREVAMRAAAFSMRILYNDLHVAASPVPARRVTLEELLENSDFITIHLPAAEKAPHPLGAAEFQRMKHGAVLLHLGPGEHIVPEALLDALNQGIVQAAALDQPDYTRDIYQALLLHPAVHATPRLAAATREGRERAGMAVCEILQEFFNV